MNVFDLMAKIGLDTSEYDRGLDQSEGKFSGFGDKIKAGFEKIKDNATSAVSAIASGVKSVVSTVGDMASSIYNATADLANYGDSIDKASQKIGISAKAYQEWEAVMQHSGTSMDSMTATFKTLANASQNATDDQAAAFAKLGMSMDDVSKMSSEDIFKNVITGLQGMEEGTERAALANTLLGRGAMEMGALLNTSAEDTQAMIDEVNRLGGVMSDEAVKASAEFNDNLQDMTTAIEGVKRGITAEFLPGASLLMKGFTSLITGSDKAQSQIVAAFGRLTNGFKNVIKRIGEVAQTLIPVIVTTVLNMLPQLAEMALDIVNSVVTGITDNLPLLIDTAVTLLETLSVGILDALPQLMLAAVQIALTLVDRLTAGDTLDLLVDAAITMILALTDGLIDATPTLIEKAPEIIEKLVDALVRNVPKLLTAAWEMIKKLTSALIEQAPQLATAAVQIVKSLVIGVKNLFANLKNLGSDIVDTIGGAIKGAAKSALTWGKDLVDNFINGIKQKWENLKDTVSDLAGSVKDFLGFSEPKKGPLSNFHTYAPDMMDLFAKGIKDNTYKITGQLETSLTDVKGTFEPDQFVVSEARERPELRQSNYNSNYNGGNIFNISIASGTISNDYDAYRAAQLISEQLAYVQASQNIAMGGIA